MPTHDTDMMDGQLLQINFSVNAHFAVPPASSLACFQRLAPAPLMA